MQFRQLLLSGLIAGAAIFLPGKVFALELPESEKQQPEIIPEQESVPGTALAQNTGLSELENTPAQNSLPVKVDGSMIPGKNMNDAVSNTQEGRVAVRGKVERAKTALQSAPLNKLPEQAKQAVKPFQSKMAIDQTPSALIKQDQDPKQILDKAATGEWRKPGIKVRQRKEANKKAADSAIQSKNAGPLSVKGKVISDGESKQKPAAKQFPAKSEKEQDITREVPVNKQGSSPPSRQKYLEENMANPSLRAKPSGGSSSERTNSANISSFYDKWFFWDHAYNLIEKHPYTARSTIFRSQWVNAPPSPPPLKAPVFLA